MLHQDRITQLEAYKRKTDLSKKLITDNQYIIDQAILKSPSGQYLII